ncbi:unnamed protein product, partial [Rotaria sordida]
MVENYNFYANESLGEKENRVDGYGLRKLHDTLKQTTNENIPTRSIKRQATSQTQRDSESDESIMFVDNGENPVPSTNVIKYTDHKKVLGFDYWWINNDGEIMGITKDISLYIYLCDTRHYPEQVEAYQITPILPIHLPPQHA